MDALTQHYVKCDIMSCSYEDVFDVVKKFTGASGGQKADIESLMNMYSVM